MSSTYIIVLLHTKICNSPRSQQGGRFATLKMVYIEARWIAAQFLPAKGTTAKRHLDALLRTSTISCLDFQYSAWNMHVVPELGS